MASAAGVAGARATLHLGSKSSKCVQCGEPDFARITRQPEVERLEADLAVLIVPSFVRIPDNAPGEQWGSNLRRWYPNPQGRSGAAWNGKRANTV
jgi:hypothetical protein